MCFNLQGLTRILNKEFNEVLNFRGDLFSRIYLTREYRENKSLVKLINRFIQYFCCGTLLLLVLAVRIYTLVQLLC